MTVTANWNGKLMFPQIEAYPPKSDAHVFPQLSHRLINHLTPLVLKSGSFQRYRVSVNRGRSIAQYFTATALLPIHFRTSVHPFLGLENSLNEKSGCPDHRGRIGFRVLTADRRSVASFSTILFPSLFFIPTPILLRVRRARWIFESRTKGMRGEARSPPPPLLAIWICRKGSILFIFGNKAGRTRVHVCVYVDLEGVGRYAHTWMADVACALQP